MTQLPMHETLPFDEATTPPRVSTGDLPMHAEIRQVVTDAYERYRGESSGTVADYIPVLAEASPDLFGIAVVGPWGRSFEIGDVAAQFSIQSVSKPFVFALVCDTVGYEEARLRLGVNSTGFPFNSLMAVELNAERTMNPLVNAGAIATTSLAPGATADEKWASIRERLSMFAGRELTVNAEVYASESATNMRNQGIAHLLKSYERLYFDPDEATDIYTRQCSLDVTVHDLAVMAATLANGGVNPATGETVIRPGVCRRVLAVMSSAGLYELSGDWLYQVGVPGKSGVSGGIVTVAPGKGGLATYSPPLDAAGNSIRGQLATKYLAERLGTQPLRLRPRRGLPTRSSDADTFSASRRLALALRAWPLRIPARTHRVPRVAWVSDAGRWPPPCSSRSRCSSRFLIVMCCLRACSSPRSRCCCSSSSSSAIPAAWTGAPRS